MGQHANPTPLVKLGETTLGALPEGVARPRYDRSRLTPGIVHIGLGNFHRAHQAWYLHRLMQAGKAHDWAIIGAGVRPADIAMRDRLKAQDWLTTLIELDSERTSAEVVGSMIGFLPIEDGNGALTDQMADPAIRVVALTVTESGYFIDPATGGFDAAHPDIAHDAANPDTPRTAFGAMIAALARRRAAGAAPFTCQSCDNLQGNGAILRQTIVSLARLSDPDLADWIEEEVGFPNSMVDCIVPATGSAELALAHELGVHDAAPVTHEAFRQWVIEDDFRAGRPPWEEIGATISNDVHTYEKMKIRILNAGHQIIANAGELLGAETIADCMAHPLIAALFRKVQSEEIAPTVASTPQMSALQYIELIERRFSNPRIVDTTRRVAYDGAARHPGFLLPTVRDQLATGGSVEGLALVEAIWARMCLGTREDGSTIEPNDPNWPELSAAANAARTAPAAWLNQTRIYGDLAASETFATAFKKWIGMIHANGTEAAIKAYLG